MRLLILGRGKTGALVAEIASQRSHQVRVVGSAENIDARALTAANLRATDVVVDFTTPQSVLPNIRACLRERKNVVVGTTGWYASLPEIRQAVEQGLAELDRGEGIPIDEVKAKIAEWAGR